MKLKKVDILVVSISYASTLVYIQYYMYMSKGLNYKKIIYQEISLNLNVLIFYHLEIVIEFVLVHCKINRTIKQIIYLYNVSL